MGWAVPEGRGGRLAGGLRGNPFFTAHLPKMGTCLLPRGKAGVKGPPGDLRWLWWLWEGSGVWRPSWAQS